MSKSVKSTTMNLPEFRKLSIEERADRLRFKGTFVGSSNYGAHVIAVYSLKETLFELWYNEEHKQIVKIQPLAANENVKQYMEKNDLLKLLYAKDQNS